MKKSPSPKGPPLIGNPKHFEVTHVIPTPNRGAGTLPWLCALLAGALLGCPGDDDGEACVDYASISSAIKKPKPPPPGPGPKK